ncbi:zymogen granule membrane protein 16-like [Antennarius striatus]|uniref:zymogen granule membrane protein 16-like n=1 Tax=Antennarius striatus TaxID=241820 RepID=UPI0035AE5AC0
MTSKMYSFLVFTVLFVGCLSKPLYIYNSFSESVGSGNGESYATSGEGRITAIRVWEAPHSYITGFQLSFNHIWDEVIGYKTHFETEMKLFENEVITQVSGKYQSTIIYQLIFVTSRGRFLIVGQPNKISFNMYPEFSDGELVKLSGHQQYNRITAIAAHWGTALLREIDDIK